MGSASGYRFDDAAVRCLAVMLFEECVFLPLLDFSLKQLPNCLKKKKKSAVWRGGGDESVPSQPQCCTAEKPQQVGDTQLTQ